MSPTLMQINPLTPSSELRTSSLLPRATTNGEDKSGNPFPFYAFPAVGVALILFLFVWIKRKNRKAKEIRRTTTLNARNNYEIPELTSPLPAYRPGRTHRSTTLDSAREQLPPYDPSLAPPKYVGAGVAGARDAPVSWSENPLS